MLQARSTTLFTCLYPVPCPLPPGQVGADTCMRALFDWFRIGTTVMCVTAHGKQANSLVRNMVWWSLWCFIQLLLGRHQLAFVWPLSVLYCAYEYCQLAPICAKISFAWGTKWTFALSWIKSCGVCVEVHGNTNSIHVNVSKSLKCEYIFLLLLHHFSA